MDLKRVQINAREGAGKEIFPLQAFTFALGQSLTELFQVCQDGEKKEIVKSSRSALRSMMNVLYEIEVVPRPERKGRSFWNLDDALREVMKAYGALCGEMWGRAAYGDKPSRGVLTLAIYDMYFALSQVWFFSGIKEDEIEKDS